MMRLRLSRILHRFRKCRREPDHICSNGIHQPRHLPVGSGTVNLRPLLMIGAEQVEGDCDGKLRFPVLFGTESDALLELPVAIFLYDAEEVTDDGLLPIEQLERLVIIAAFSMTQALDEHDSPVSFFPVIMRRRQQKPRRLVFIHMGSRSFRRDSFTSENIFLPSNPQ